MVISTYISTCLVIQSCPTLCEPMDYSLPGSSVCGDSPGKNTGVACHFPSPGDLPNPGIKPESPALAGSFFTAEPWPAQSNSLLELKLIFSSVQSLSRVRVFATP